MSWRESPMNTAVSGAAPSRASAASTGSGCGLGCVTSSDPTITSKASASSATWRPRSAPLRILLRSEEHTSELQSHSDLVCRLLLEKKKTSHDCLNAEHN